MNLPSVAIVILNWNGRKLLEQFLPSVIATTYTNHTIVIADNASTDDSIAFLKQQHPNLKIIVNPTNEGFAKGYNTALQQVKADYYVLLNSDVEVHKDWLNPIMELMANDKSIGVCQPKLLSFHQKNYFEYAGAAGGLLDNLGYPFAKGRVFETCEKDTLQYEGNSPIFWASGAAMVVQSSVYHQLNGLEEYFFAHQEEIDFCWRVQLLGYKVMVCTEAIVYHVGAATLQKGSARKTYLNFRNNLIMLSKNLPSFQGKVIILKRFFLDALAAYTFLLKGDVKSYFAVAKAHLHFIRWRIFKKQTNPLHKKRIEKLDGVINTSIVYKYFVQKKKTYAEILNHK